MRTLTEKDYENLVLKIIKKDEEVIKTLNDLARTDKKLYAELINHLKPVYYDMYNLKGLYTRSEPITHYKMRSILDASKDYPFGKTLEEKISMVSSDLKVKIPAEAIKQYIEDEEERDKRLSVLEKFGGAGVFASAILRAISPRKGKILVQALERFLGGAGGTALLVEQFDDVITKKDIKEIFSLENIIQLSLGTYGLTRLFAPFPKSAKSFVFKYANDETLALEKKFIENYDKVVDETLQKLKEGFSYLKPISDNLSLSMNDVLKMHLENYNILSDLKKLFKHYEDELTAIATKGKAETETEKEILESLNKVVNRKEISKIFLKFKPQKIDFQDETGLIHTSYDYEDAIQYMDNIKGNIRALIYTDKGVQERIFMKDYLPAFARNYIVKYNLPTVGTKTQIVPETKVLDLLDDIQAQGGEVIKVFAPSFKKITTGKFVKSLIDTIQKRIQDKDIEEIDDIISALKKDDRIKELVKEAQSEVWTFSKTQDLGFLKTADDPLNLLYKNYATKLFNPYPHFKIEEIMKLPDTSHGIQMFKNIVRYIEDTRKLTVLDDFNNAVKKLWLLGLAHIPLLNGVIQPAFLVMTKFFSKGLFREAQEFFKTYTNELLNSKGTLKEEFKKLVEMSPADFITFFVRAPAIWNLNAMKKTLKNYAELIDLNPDNLDAFLFSESALSHPSFFTAKIGNIPVSVLNSLSAFFSANYIPLYSVAKAFYDSLKFKKLAPFLAVGATTGIYATLIGARNSFPFAFIDSALKFSDAVVEMFSDEENPLQNLLASYTAENVEKFADLLTLITSQDLADPLVSLFMQIALGNGVIGYLTKMKTEAGATFLPQILDAPVLQLTTSLIRNIEENKKRFRDERDIPVLLKTTEQTLLQNLGFLRRIRENFIGKITAIAERKPEEFEKGLVKFLFPESYFENPVFTSFLNAETIKKTREQGLLAVHNIFGQLQKADRTTLVQQLDKALESHLKSIDKAQVKSEYAKNIIFMLTLRSHLKGKELNEEKLTLLEPYLTKEEIIRYAQKVKKDIRIAEKLTK